MTFSRAKCKILDDSSFFYGQTLNTTLLLVTLSHFLQMQYLNFHLTVFTRCAWEQWKRLSGLWMHVPLTKRCRLRQSTLGTTGMQILAGGVCPSCNFQRLCHRVDEVGAGRPRDVVQSRCTCDQLRGSVCSLKMCLKFLDIVYALLYFVLLMYAKLAGFVAPLLRFPGLRFPPTVPLVMIYSPEVAMNCGAPESVSWFFMSP